MPGGVLDHRGVPGLPLLVEQPVLEQIGGGALFHVLLQLAVCLHGVHCPVGLLLGLRHGRLYLRLRGLVGLLLPALGAVLCPGLLFALGLLHGIRQLCGLSGQLRVHGHQIIVHGIITGLILFIIGLDILHGRGLALGQFVIIPRQVQSLLHIGLQPGLRGIGAVQLLQVALRRGVVLGSRFLQGLPVHGVIFGGIVGKALRLCRRQQALVPDHVLHGHLLEVVSPGQGIGIHLGGEVAGGVYAHHVQVIGVLAQVIAHRHIVIVVELHLGYVLSVHLHVAAVHREVVADGEGRHQAHKRRHDHDAQDIVPAPALLRPFLLLLSPLHLQIIFRHHLLRCLIRILCLFLGHAECLLSYSSSCPFQFLSGSFPVSVRSRIAYQPLPPIPTYFTMISRVRKAISHIFQAFPRYFSCSRPQRGCPGPLPLPYS